MVGKKGDEKYSPLISMILGIIFLALLFYFLFYGYFTKSDIDMEMCRESIQIRSLMPEAKVSGFDLFSFKDRFPLKCKTMRKVIEKSDLENVSKANKIIAESMAECWALYDKGDSSAFPSKFYFIGSTCVPCSRIHLSEDAKKYMIDNNVKIDIRKAMDERMSEGYSYYTYLQNAGKKFPAFSPASAREFDLEGDRFEIDDSGGYGAIFINKLTGGVDDGVWINGVHNKFDISKVSLPKLFDPEGGDLLISYGIITSANSGNIGDYIPYLFYFQTEQKIPNPLDEAGKQLIDGELWKNANLCEMWEGIPA